MPFHDNGLLFLTTSLVIQIYDLEHDSRCERHTVFALKCFRRHMLLEICSKCEILLKCCPKCEKVLKGAQNAKKCSKGAQRNRERPTPVSSLGSFQISLSFVFHSCVRQTSNINNLALPFYLIQYYNFRLVVFNLLVSRYFEVPPQLVVS